MLAFSIASLTGLAIIGLIWAGHLIDRHDAESLYRAHRKEKRVRTIIRERGHDQQIIGEWVKP